MIMTIFVILCLKCYIHFIYSENKNGSGNYLSIHTEYALSYGFTAFVLSFKRFDLILKKCCLEKKLHSFEKETKSNNTQNFDCKRIYTNE